MYLSKLSSVTILSLSLSLLTLPAAARNTNEYDSGYDRPRRLDGKPIANSPYERMAQGDAYAVDHLTHRPVDYRPEANSRLIFAVAFEKESEAIWALQHGATATEAIALCMSTKEHTEKNYGAGICEKVEARFTGLAQHECNYQTLVRFCVGGAAVAVVATVTGLYFCGKWAINKIKTA